VVAPLYGRVELASWQADAMVRLSKRTQVAGARGARWLGGSCASCSWISLNISASGLKLFFWFGRIINNADHCHLLFNNLDFLSLVFLAFAPLPLGRSPGQPDQ